jgi:hypothetical protein
MVHLIYHVLILGVGMTADYLASELAVASTTQSFSNKYYTVDNMQYMVDKLQRIWKEAVVA